MLLSPKQMRILGLKLPDAVALTAYGSLVFAAIAHHEPWSDEAQAWLMGRDTGFGDLLFRALRYEGSPGLWHV